METLSDALIDSIGDNIYDISANAGDTALEILVGEDSIVSGIPFVSTVISMYKIGRSVIELNHIRQLSIFISEINKETIDKEKKNKYISKFKAKEEKARNQELEYVVLITGKYINRDNPKYLAKLYLAYLDGIIKWEEFSSYSQVIERILPQDIETIECGNQKEIRDEDVSDSLLRLSALGLFNSITEDTYVTNTVGQIKYPGNVLREYRLTPFGKKLRDVLGFTDMAYLEKTISSLQKKR